ncbi:7573_t:CDS:2 [Funneliformis caledonium]|uniref:7573_t:CDS:1 n=1 Tax=Funneliformis caledonium TaxID=1117310 RepID=A0A9N9EZZ9_9GLOM|nr:7573_t:CDS:2 [Funneliformis caledonium]
MLNHGQLDHFSDSKSKNVVQIYSYMADLELHLTLPPVLKAYAYLAHIAKDDSESSYPI